jgi:hypothetical protein
MKSIPVGRYAKRGEDVAHRRIARSCPRLARLVKDLGQALRIVHSHHLSRLQSDSDEKRVVVWSIRSTLEDTRSQLDMG